MKKGLLIIIAGPSGVGKGTIRNELMKNPELNLGFSVSYTTRGPRTNEKDGEDYFFISHDEFKELIKRHQFIEYTKYVGNYYGSSKLYVDQLRKKGKNVILEIETNGAKNIIKQFDKNEVVSFFVMPPSLEELGKRIRGRLTETEKIIESRLKKARKELKKQKLFNYIIVNDSPKRASDEIKDIILNKINIEG